MTDHRLPETSVERFLFPFDRAFLLAGLPFGVRPSTCSLEIDALALTARFGPWTVHTPRANVASAEATGPYHLAKVIGPPHLSFVDRGLTFATTTHQGVCIRFHEPVRGMDPMGAIRHPSLTVTVEDCERLVHLLTQDPELSEDQQVLVDKLSGLSAAQLRERARQASRVPRGCRRPISWMPWSTEQAITSPTSSPTSDLGADSRFFVAVVTHTVTTATKNS